MLAERDLATIRAALAFWREEMTPHANEAQAPYFDHERADPLTGEEIDRLRERLRSASLRTARFVGPRALRLLAHEEIGPAVVARERLVAVLISQSESIDS